MNNLPIISFILFWLCMLNNSTVLPGNNKIKCPILLENRSVTQDNVSQNTNSYNIKNQD